MKRPLILLLGVAALVVAALTLIPSTGATTSEALWPGSLCVRSEQIIFSCVVRRANSRTARDKLASLCASRTLTKNDGYLQYRFGLPGKVELQYPSTRTGTQQLFQYTHYMRFQVDLTEINFTIENHQYQIFDSYNGEEKPAISDEGVNVTLSDGTTNATFNCRAKAKADYSMLSDVLQNHE